MMSPPRPDDDAASRLALRLARQARPPGVRRRLLKAGRDRAMIWLHEDEDGGRIVEKRVSRLAAARHASGELLFHTQVSGALNAGLLAPRVHLAHATARGARLLLEYVEASHWNLFRQAGELAGAVTAAEDELAHRLHQLAGDHRLRLAFMTPLNRPAWSRPRGGWPRRLGTAGALAANYGLAAGDAAARWRRGLSALEDRVRRGDQTLANADLIKPNLRYRDGLFTALDWGAAAVAPRGYDVGVLLAALLRYDDRFVFRDGEAQIRQAAALEDRRDDAALYAFLAHALDHLSSPLYRDLMRDNPALAQDKLSIVVQRLETL